MTDREPAAELAALAEALSGLIHQSAQGAFPIEGDLAEARWILDFLGARGLAIRTTTHQPAAELAARDLPHRIVVGANGAYWRDYGNHYSMCPVSADNDPVEVVAVYLRAALHTPNPTPGDVLWTTRAVERLARSLYDEAMTAGKLRRPSWDEMLAWPNNPHNPKKPTIASNITMLSAYRAKARAVADRYAALSTGDW